MGNRSPSFHGISYVYLYAYLHLMILWKSCKKFSTILLFNNWFHPLTWGKFLWRLISDIECNRHSSQTPVQSSSNVNLNPSLSKKTVCSGNILETLLSWPDKCKIIIVHATKAVTCGLCPKIFSKRTKYQNMKLCWTSNIIGLI